LDGRGVGLDDLIHELSGLYAIDALSSRDKRRYQAHLSGCPRCRRDVAAFRESTAALAFAVSPADPPPSLRANILSAVHDSRRPRHLVRLIPPRFAFATVAIAAALVVGIGIWVTAFRSTSASFDTTLAALRLSGSNRALLVVRDRTGQSELLVVGLPPARPGMTYESWVIQAGTARNAGLFAGRTGIQIVPLTRRVPKGSVVAITVERAQGVARLHRRPLIVSKPA
jgi:anti-sigma-K factor RskA